MKYIYTVSDPVTKGVFYVGATVNLEQRAKQHLNPCIEYRITNKIREILSNGNHPIFTVIETALENWREIEQKWIIHFIENGSPILNREIKWHQKNKDFKKSIILIS